MMSCIYYLLLGILAYKLAEQKRPREVVFLATEIKAAPLHKKVAMFLFLYIVAPLYLICELIDALKK